MDANTLRFGRFTLDKQERRFTKDGIGIHLTRKGFDLLVFLLENPHRLLSKQQLLQAVWRDTAVQDSSLAQVVSELRRKLDKSDDCWVETVSGYGYRFHVNLEPEERLQTNRVAVFPLTAVPARTENKLLGLAIADEVISQLTKNRQISVLPTSAMLRVPGTEDLLQAARKLGAMWVVSGLVRVPNSTAKITVQVSCVEDGRTVFALAASGKARNLQHSQKPVVAKIARFLSLHLKEAIKGGGRQSSESAEVHDLLTNVEYLWKWRSAQGLELGISYLKRAIELEPASLRAHVLMANFSLALAPYRRHAPRPLFEQAFAASRTALDLDDQNADAHLCMALSTLRRDLDFTKAERELNIAIKLRPDHARTLYWYGNLLGSMRRFGKSLEVLTRASHLAPESLSVRSGIAMIHVFQGNLNAAKLLLTEITVMSPNLPHGHFGLGLIAGFEGDRREAVRRLARAARLSEQTLWLSSFAYAEALWGKRADARNILRRLVEQQLGSYVSSYDLAVIYGALGEGEKAIALLSRAIDERDVLATVIAIDPRLSTLSGRPEFKTLLAANHLWFSAE